MKLKKVLLFIGMLFLTLSLGACVEKTIDAPKDVKIEGTVVTWSAVSEAEGYIVIVNNEEKAKINELKYDVASLELGEATICIRAYKKKIVSLDSEAVKYLSQISVPTDIVVVNGTVSWKAVPEATKYIITVKGIEKETTESRYDLSAFEFEDGEITIKAVCNTAVSEDSPSTHYYKDVNKSKNDIFVFLMSTKGYDNVNAKAEDFEYNQDYIEFLEEKEESNKLIETSIEKGLNVNDLRSLYNLIEEIDKADGEIPPDQIIGKIVSFLESDVNFEGIISLIVDEVAINLIDEQIEEQKEDIAYYSKNVEIEPSQKDYYERRIAECEKSIAMLEVLKKIASSFSDKEYKALVNIIANLKNILKDVNAGLLDDVMALLPSEQNPKIDFESIIGVKDDAIDIVLNNLPNEEDLVVLYDFVTNAVKELEIESVPLMSSQEAVDRALTSIRLVLGYLKSIDSEYILDIVSFETSLKEAAEEEAFEAVEISQIFVALYVATDIYEYMQTEEVKAQLQSKVVDEQIIAKFKENLSLIIDLVKEDEGLDLNCLLDVDYLSLVEDIDTLAIYPTTFLSYTSQTEKAVVYSYFEFVKDPSNEENLNKLIGFIYSYLEAFLLETKEDEIGAFVDIIVAALDLSKNIAHEISGEDTKQIIINNAFMLKVKEISPEIKAILKDLIPYLSEIITFSKENKLIETIILTGDGEELALKLLEEVVYSENNAKIVALVEKVFELIDTEEILVMIDLTSDELEEIKNNVLGYIKLPVME